MTGTSCGVVYFATASDHDIEGAFLSAESVRRRCPGLGTTLFAMQPDHPLCRTPWFDTVVPVSAAKSELMPIPLLEESPYEATLYLANDARVVAPSFQDLFSISADVDLAMAEATPEASAVRRHIGKPAFDTAVIFYRRNPRTTAWLAAWTARVQRHRTQTEQPAAEQRDLLLSTQMSLFELVNPASNAFGLTVRILSPAWGQTDFQVQSNTSVPTVIRRSPQFQASTRADLLALAHDWKNMGRVAESEHLYGYLAGRLGPTVRFPEAWATPALRAADLHLRIGQGDRAMHVLDAAGIEDSQFPFVLVGRARCALQAGRSMEALNLAVESVKRAPESGYARMFEGIALLANSRFQEALIPLAIAGQNDPVAAFHLGNTYRHIGDPASAAPAYARALALDPRHMDAAANLIPVLMRVHRYDDALRAADQMLARQPWHVPGLAYKCIALTELGRSDAHRALADFDRLAVCQRLEAPAGYGSLADFNKALGTALMAEPSLARDPAAHATRNGWHSGDLTKSPAKEIQALCRMILEVVERRISNVDGDHPFARARPRFYRLHAWAIVMEEGGHQIPHIHNSGWLSGVYYVDVPEDISPDDATHAGWLTFGRGDPRWQRETTTVEEHFVCPVGGLLVTFPSFFWHGTRPLRSTQRRISFAFDVIPAHPWTPES